MRQALNLAVKGQGWVEPNPMVGCVLVRDDQLIGTGYHQKFGAAHAEINAIADARAAGHSPTHCTAYVTLEPCAHHGKTPPCTGALIAAGIQRVVVALPDPFPAVSGRGLVELEAAGISVTVGVLATEAARVVAPYLKRIQRQRPWLIAKWAMTLDGRIASAHGDSQWITGPAARGIVHQLRARVDAVMVGIGTALMDNPRLTARMDETSSPDHSPPDPSPVRTPLRIASRVVVDRQLRLPLDSRLVQSAKQVPLLIATSLEVDAEKIARLIELGAEIWQPDRGSGPASEVVEPAFEYSRWVDDLLQYLARQGMTNVLVEGGGHLLGNLFDNGQLDEAYVFVAPKIIGGQEAIAPVLGVGHRLMSQAGQLRRVSHQVLLPDVLIHGFLEAS